MRLVGSLWRKVFVTGLAVGAFVSMYEPATFDSKYAGYELPFTRFSETPAPGARLAFTATAYCKGLLTTSGVAAQSGVAAADPLLLPAGSVVQVESGGARHDGIYSVLDTGPSVHGREIDLYIWSCNDALRFGRKRVALTVLRLGWSPQATTPGFFKRFFRHAESPAVLPSRPLSLDPSRN